VTAVCLIERHRLGDLDVFGGADTDVGEPHMSNESMKAETAATRIVA
jgi:hypothetical protein